MKKYRKVICLFLSVMVFGLTACGSEEHVIENTGETQTQQQASDEEGQDSQEASGTEAQTGSGYYFTYNDSQIYVDEDMALVLEAIGEADSYYEAASCAFENELDKTYTYQGFQIVTYPQGEQDLTSYILLQDDTVETSEGIRIGSSREEVLETYGEEGTEDGSMLTYEKDGMKLCFILSMGEVSSIQYLSTFLEG